MILAILCYLHIHSKVIGSPKLRLLDLLVTGDVSRHCEEIQHGFVCRGHDPFHIRRLARRIAIAPELVAAGKGGIERFLGNKVDTSTLSKVQYAHQLVFRDRETAKKKAELTRAQKLANSSPQSSRFSPSQTYPLPIASKSAFPSGKRVCVDDFRSMTGLRTNCYSIDTLLPLLPVRSEVFDYLLNTVANADDINLGPKSISIPLPDKRRAVS